MTPQTSGWYEDPQDPTLLRYWDGVVWTNHTSPRTSPTIGQSTIGRPVPVPGVSGYPGQTPYQGQPPAGSPPADPGRPTYPGGPGQPGPAGRSPYGAPGQPWRQSPWQPQPTTADGAPLAAWWQRLLGRLLDSLLLSGVSTIVALPWLGSLLTQFTTYINESVSAADNGTAPPSATAFYESVATFLIPYLLITLALSLVYETFFLMRSGATPGKMALGTRVRRVDRPGPLSFVEALRRQVITLGGNAFSLVPVLGLLASVLVVVDEVWLLWDPRRQCLHDKVADTVVIRTR